MSPHVDVEALQQKLRFRFRVPDLLAQAMIHRSYLNEMPNSLLQSNERLEFLGDAVLGCVIARWLYCRFPRIDEGRLTELRAHIVKGETLGLVAKRIELGPFLVMGRGEAATGGRTRPLNLARAFESLIGAMMIDRGYERTEQFVLRVLHEELMALGDGNLPTDSKTRLQHAAQSRFGRAPRYVIVGADGPDHAKVFRVEVVVGDLRLGSGAGRSKRVAEREAAEQALAYLSALP